MGNHESIWSPNPNDRPEFEEILKKLSNLKKVLRSSVRGTQLQDPTTGEKSKPTGEIKPGGENYLTISEFKKGVQEGSLNSDEEYNTMVKKNSQSNNNTKSTPKPANEDDTYNKVNVKLTAQDVTTEDDYKAIIHLKSDSTSGVKLPPPISSPNDEDTYNKINFKNEFSAQSTNAGADEVITCR